MVERVRGFLEGSESVECRGLTTQEKYYVETRNGSVVRKQLGYAYIPTRR